jgi:tetratricopeptide (TPR) repeat protein
MTIDAKVFSPDHPDVAAALNNLARVLVDRRKFAEAIPLLERSVAINVKQRTADDDDMAFVFSNLALAEHGVGRISEAESLLKKALAIARAHNHRMLAPILSELADIQCQRGDTAGGGVLLNEARPIMLANYPQIAWRAAWIDNVMGECLLRHKSFDAGRALIFTSAPVILDHWTPESLYGYQATRRLQWARSERSTNPQN